MTGTREKEIRVLSLDLHPRGFGYAVFEGTARLVDWGTTDIRKNKQYAVLRKIGELMRLYQPKVLVVEDCAHVKSRRNLRVRQLAETILVAVQEFGVEGHALPLAAVYRMFAKSGASTKYEIASTLVRAFPELMVSLPPKRKPWQSEDGRMSIFDAVALGLAYFDRRRGTEPARPRGP